MLCAQPASVSCFVAILTECCSPTVPPQRPVSLLWNWWKRSLMAGVQDGDKVLELLFVLLLFFLPLPLFLHIAAFSAVCHLLISHSLSHSHKLAHSSFFFLPWACLQTLGPSINLRRSALIKVRSRSNDPTHFCGGEGGENQKLCSPSLLPTAAATFTSLLLLPPARTRLTTGQDQWTFTPLISLER